MRQPADGALDRLRELEGTFDSQRHGVRANATKRMTSLNVLLTDPYANTDCILSAMREDQ